jgi:hypothetical protein
MALSDLDLLELTIITAPSDISQLFATTRGAVRSESLNKTVPKLQYGLQPQSFILPWFYLYTNM